MTIIKSSKTFNEETGKSLKNTSQLKLFDILIDLDNNESFINIFKCYNINDMLLKNKIYFNTYEVDEADFPDTISYKFYGTPNLWWLIAMINNIVNPYEEFYAGRTLRIIKPTYLYKMLKEIDNIGTL